MKLFQLFTDGANRPAIELVLGLVFAVAGLVYALGAFGKPDLGILGAILGFAGANVGLNTIGNLVTDSRAKPGSGA